MQQILDGSTALKKKKKVQLTSILGPFNQPKQGLNTSSQNA